MEKIIEKLIEMLIPCLTIIAVIFIMSQCAIQNNTPNPAIVKAASENFRDAVK